MLTAIIRLGQADSIKRDSKTGIGVCQGSRLGFGAETARRAASRQGGSRNQPSANQPARQPPVEAGRHRRTEPNAQKQVPAGRSREVSATSQDPPNRKADDRKQSADDSAQRERSLTFRAPYQAVSDA